MAMHSTRRTPARTPVRRASRAGRRAKPARDKWPATRRTAVRRTAVTGTAVATTVALLSVGGVAWAWFGVGSGTGSVSTADAGTITAEVGAIDALAPGVQLPVTITIDNQAGGPVTITGLTVGQATLARPGAGPCDPAAVTLRPDLPPDTASPLVAPQGRSFVPAIASMSADAPDGCQGAAFALSLVVTGTL